MTQGVVDRFRELQRELLNQRKPPVVVNEWTEEKLADLVKRREAGESFRDIGKIYGVTGDRIRQVHARAERNARHKPLRDKIRAREAAEAAERAAAAHLRANPADPLDLPVDELEVTVRTANCLRNGGYKTLRDVCKEYPAALLRTPNFGRKSLKDLREALQARGVYLNGEGPAKPVEAAPAKPEPEKPVPAPPDPFENAEIIHYRKMAETTAANAAERVKMILTNIERLKRDILALTGQVFALKAEMTKVDDAIVGAYVSGYNRGLGSVRGFVRRDVR